MLNPLKVIPVFKLKFTKEMARGRTLIQRILRIFTPNSHNLLKIISEYPLNRRSSASNSDFYFNSILKVKSLIPQIFEWFNFRRFPHRINRGE